MFAALVLVLLFYVVWCVLRFSLQGEAGFVKWRVLRWRLLTAVVVGVPLILLAALLFPALPPASFNANKWKSGNRWSRGAMVQDLIDRHLLLGKSRSDVLDLLGEPDYCAVSTGKDAHCANPKVDWFAYKVVTISRCNFFWECRMEVGFNDTSYRVEDLGVSD